MPNQSIELSEIRVAEISGSPYLSLQLEPDVSVAIDLDLVQETFVTSADQLTLMPNVHPCLIGLIEHRSNIFWTVDLPQLLGFTPFDTTSIDYHIAVLEVRGELLGIAIRRIGRVMRFADEAICSPLDLNLPAPLTPFLRGVLLQSSIDSEGRIYVLDAESIAMAKLS